MLRLLTIIGLVLVGIVLAGSVTWYLAHGFDGTSPEVVTIEGIAAPVEIGWSEDGVVQIRADDEAGVYTGIGYAQAWARTWPMALYRQAALGRLAEWFGDAALSSDRLARRLELATRAQAAFDSMDVNDRALLQAYTDGVNAAWRYRDRKLTPELVLLDLELEPWQPWQTLAIERLFAWLAASPPDTLAPAADSLLTWDRQLRVVLLSYGFEHSIAWAARDSAGSHFFQRHVYGASALPFLQETLVSWGDSIQVTGAALPGTPFFPAGRTNRAAWALLLHTERHLVPIRVDSSSLAVHFDRMRSLDSTEYLVTIRSADQRLLLDVPDLTPIRPALRPDTLRVDSLVTRRRSPAPPPDPIAPFDSVWAMEWSGLYASTDFPAWRALLRGEAPSFSLQRGDGLRVLPGGEWEVMGSPSVVATMPNGIFVGTTSWSQEAAEQLKSLLEDTLAVEVRAWSENAVSLWAARAAPPLISELGGGVERTDRFEEALTYLLNWDFGYDRASIAASIFDTWMTIYQDSLESVSMKPGADTLSTVEQFRYRALRQQTLEQALDSLEARFGPDLSQWRWERVQPARLRFPVWSVDSMGTPHHGRFAPLDLSGYGHPSALAWGASPVQKALPAPANWQAWVDADDWDRFYVRRWAVEVQRPLGRYLIPERLPPPVSLDEIDFVYTTTLLPPSL